MPHLTTHADPQAIGHPAVDFEYKLNVSPTGNSREIARNRILMNPLHDTCAIGKHHIQRYECIFHPERHCLLSFVNKQHARHGRHIIHKHEPTAALIRCVSHVDGELGITPITSQKYQVFLTRRICRKGG